MVDENYPGRVIIAEANQPPDEVVEYFGNRGGPECHMAFHFPIMPRLFYALRDQKAAPIIETMRDTPDIPDGRPVGNLPAEPRRAHPGDGDPRRSAQPCSAGTPRIPGCGPTSASAVGWPRCWTTPAPRSNSSTRCCCPCRAARSCTTGTRSAWATTSGSTTATPSRTPMQWNPDRNAGFSTADPGKLYLPRHPVAGLPLQPWPTWKRRSAHSGSLLHWMRQMLASGATTRPSGSAATATSKPSHDVVLPYLRELPEGECGGRADAETMLCVFNLSQHPVAAKLRLPAVRRRGLRDLFGGQPFPAFGDDGDADADAGQPRLLLAADPLGVLPTRPRRTRRRCRSSRSRTDMSQPILTPALTALLRELASEAALVPGQDRRLRDVPGGRRGPGGPGTGMPGLPCSSWTSPPERPTAVPGPEWSRFR